MMKLGSILFFSLLVGTGAFAAGICDRSITFDSLSEAEKAGIEQQQLVSRFEKQSNGYYIGYIFTQTVFDPELATGVYSSANEHAGANGLGDFIVQSKIVSDDGKNPFRVFYEQYVSWPYKNGEYTSEVSLTQAQGGYLMESKLIGSSDSGFSPQFVDAYIRFVPAGSGSFVVACNYMIPRSGSWKNTFNDLARERLIQSGQNLLRWVTRVSADQNQIEFYRKRLRRLLAASSVRARR